MGHIHPIKWNPKYNLCNHKLLLLFLAYSENEMSIEINLKLEQYRTLNYNIILQTIKWNYIQWRHGVFLCEENEEDNYTVGKLYTQTENLVFASNRISLYVQMLQTIKQFLIFLRLEITGS